MLTLNVCVCTCKCVRVLFAQNQETKENKVSPRNPLDSASPNVTDFLHRQCTFTACARLDKWPDCVPYIDPSVNKFVLRISLALCMAYWETNLGVCSFLLFLFLVCFPKTIFFSFSSAFRIYNRTMTAICFVCNLPIMSHQVGLVWQGGNGWDDLVREQVGVCV